MRPRPALSRILDIRRRRERARESLGVGAFARFLRDERPDLILINGEMHEHIIAASAAGARVALLNSFVSIWRQPGLPPPHTLARPGIGWTGTRAGASLLWLALRLRKRYRRLVRARAPDRLRPRVGVPGPGPCRRLRVRTGHRRPPVADSVHLPAPARAEPARAGVRVHPHPARARSIRRPHGARVAHRPAAGTRRTATGSTRSSRGAARPADGRLIYAGFGSVFSTDLAFLRRLLGIVEQRPGWELVVSLSHRVAPSDLGPLPARVHTFPWVPQVRRAAARRRRGDARWASAPSTSAC